MEKPAVNLVRLELKYAGVQSSYYLNICTFAGFVSVYLGFKGLNNTQIGLTSSAVSVLSIILQLWVSNYSDNHAQIPIKKIIATIYIIVISCIAALSFLPLPIFLLTLFYVIAGGFVQTQSGLNNALLIQYVNIGLPVRYGWPRGVSAIVYAGFAFLMGIMLEKSSPAILMPLSLGLCIVALFFVLQMPRPDEISPFQNPPSFDALNTQTSYRELLSSSASLNLFLLASILMFAGQSNSMLFLPNLVESYGGTRSNLGLAIFIQSGIEMPAMFLSPWLMKRVKPSIILCVSMGAYVFKALILFLAQTLQVFYLAMCISFLCFGLYGSCSLFFVNTIVKPCEKVRAQSLVAMCGAVGGILGNSIAGNMIDSFGIPALNLVCFIFHSMAFILMIFAARAEDKNEKNLSTSGSL